MIIKVKKRIRSLNVISGVECEGLDTIAYFHGGSVRLSRDELERIVGANAPYNWRARDEFFARLRERADTMAPTES